MWSFVANKKNKQWIWLALDIETKEIVGVYVGERSRQGALMFMAIFTPSARGSVLCVTPIFGLPMMRFSPSLGIGQLVKKVVRII